MLKLKEKVWGGIMQKKALEIAGIIMGIVAVVVMVCVVISYKDSDKANIFTARSNSEGLVITGIMKNAKVDDELIFPDTISGKKVVGISLYASEYAKLSKSIEKIEVKTKLEKIDSKMFASFINLKEIKLPDTIVTIEDGAFEYCTNLEKINIDELDNLKEIGENALCNTMWYKNQIADKKFLISNNILLGINTDDKKIEVPGGVKTIAKEAFASNDNITEIILPESVTNINAGAFSKMALLESVVLPLKLQRIEYGTFSMCSNLVYVNTDELTELKMIDEMAFYRCINLNITLPSDNIKIGKNAFKDIKGTTISKTE